MRLPIQLPRVEHDVVPYCDAQDFVSFVLALVEIAINLGRRVELVLGRVEQPKSCR
jgi:hypothetical protein